MNLSPIDPCKIIAEIGLSHEGSLGFAFSAIESAAKSGADVVKFQVHSAFHESSSEEKFRIAFSKQDQTRADYWERTAFSTKQWAQLIEHCNQLRVEFSASVFNSYSLNQMIDLGVYTIKLGSGDLLNQEFQDVLQEFSGFLILSTGMATWAEIQSAIDSYSRFKKEERLAVLQCTSRYPTDLRLVGINVMEEISRKFNIPSGLSDHTSNLSSSVIAISKGARFIEKHVVFSREMFGPDVSSSIDFSELKRLTDFRDDFLLISNQVDKDKLARELQETRVLFGRSLGLKGDFSEGHVLRIEDFCLRKPHGGLSWDERLEFVGKKLSRPYSHQNLFERSHVVLD
jgi:N-acetylneuraminate synthase